MITTFEKIYVLKTYLILLRTIFGTTHKGGKEVKKYIQVLYHELVLFLKSRNCFCYVPDNDIEGNILGWTPSLASSTMTATGFGLMEVMAGNPH